MDSIPGEEVYQQEKERWRQEKEKRDRVERTWGGPSSSPSSQQKTPAPPTGPPPASKGPRAQVMMCCLFVVFRAPLAPQCSPAHRRGNAGMAHNGRSEEEEGEK